MPTFRAKHLIFHSCFNAVFMKEMQTFKSYNLISISNFFNTNTTTITFIFFRIFINQIFFFFFLLFRLLVKINVFIYLYIIIRKVLILRKITDKKLNKWCDPSGRCGFLILFAKNWLLFLIPHNYYKCILY